MEVVELLVGVVQEVHVVGNSIEGGGSGGGGGGSGCGGDG